MNIIKLSLLSTAFIFASLGPVFANPHDHPLNVITVLKNLEAAGYMGVEEVTLTAHGYDVTAYTKVGVKVELHVDAVTGNVPAQTEMKHLSILEVAKRIEDAGYKTIYEIKLKHDHYSVHAFNAQGQKIRLIVNPATGAVSVKNFF